MVWIKCREHNDVGILACFLNVGIAQVGGCLALVSRTGSCFGCGPPHTSGVPWRATSEEPTQPRKQTYPPIDLNERALQIIPKQQTMTYVVN